MNNRGILVALRYRVAANQGWLALLMLLGVATSLPARTITLTAEDCDKMACLYSVVPKQSWSVLQTPNYIDVGSQMQFRPGMVLLLRYPLDRIPKGQRILKAELNMNAQYVGGPSRMQVRRIVADWGVGVNYKYASQFPKKVEWAQPGGLGAADRASKDTAVVPFKAVGDHVADVTEDVDLWYNGAAPNRGWSMTLENDQGLVYLAGPYSPHYATPKEWKLQITFEPK